MELRGIPFSGLIDLFHSDIVGKAVKSSWVQHDEVIRKAVLMERKPSLPSYALRDDYGRKDEHWESPPPPLQVLPSSLLLFTDASRTG